jgi:hypothetical protein
MWQRDFGRRPATLEQAQRYLARVMPWPQDGEAPAFTNIHYTFVPDDHDGKKPYPWAGRACRSLDEAVNVVGWAQKLPNTRDIYVCMSTQRAAKQEKEDKLGRKYYTAMRSAQNAVAIKTLFLDIDFKGGEHGYDTQDQAIKELARFLKETKLPKPGVFVLSGGGLHTYWPLARALTIAEWQPLASALAEATKQHGFKCDSQVTVDAARVLRVPSTKNCKLDTPRPVTLAGISDHDYNVETIAKALEPYKVATPQRRTQSAIPAPSASVLAKFANEEAVAGSLSDGIEKQEFPPIKLDDVARECAFIRDAIVTGGLAYDQSLWNLTTLLSVFTAGGNADAHRMGWKHPGYTTESTDELYDRKLRERDQKDLGWTSCHAISMAGCKACKTCPHLVEGKTPFHFANALPSQTAPVATPAESVSFADPWAEFVGPPFPLQILPAPLTSFVDAEHRAMGADPSALAMAALTVVGSAMHAETCVRAGEGWDEKPIFWTTLVGPPSAMKSPIIQKVTAPLRKIDHQRDAVWRQQFTAWKQTKAAGTNPGPSPAKPGRLLVQDATHEKIAEILARDPAGSLLVHDELAGWFGSFERYNSGQASRAFYLSSWNGGCFLKDRVGQGARDDGAEIRVDNLALGVLGGIQPDRLAALRDLTSDGLLQRFLPVLMRAPERGDESYPVSAAENDYAKLIGMVQGTHPPIRYKFAPDAALVRRGVLDRLFSLEQVDGFPSALIGAIGKLRGYYARFALTLHAAGEHTAMMQGQCLAPGSDIPRSTAEAAERLLFDFVLPHMFGLYDVIADAGKERETVRTLASFILANDKNRLRPSDITAGVRKLRGEPHSKIAEWASRFCAMGWLQPECEKTAIPSAWLVVPGLREHFADRREQARVARAQAHAILKAGGARA